MAIPWAILGQLALQAGQSYLGGKAQQAEQRAMNRARERQRVAQEKENNRVNLMNAFGGNARAAQIPVTYRGSDRANTLRSLGQVAGLGSQAIGLYSGMKEAEAARQAAEETGRLQNTAAQMTIDRQIGEAAGQAAPLPTDRMLGKGVSIAPPQGVELLRAVGQSGVQYPEGVTSDYGRSVFDATIRQRQAGASDRARERELFDLQKQLTSARIGLATAQAEAEKRQPASVANNIVKNATENGKALANQNPNMSADDITGTAFFTRAMSEDPTGTAASQLVSAYMMESPVVKRQMRQDNETVLNDLYSAAKNEPFIKIRGDVSRGLTEMVQASKQESGFADIGMLKALARLQDPNSVVREEEFRTMENAQSVMDRYGVKLEGFVKGNRLTDEGRKLVLELGFASYEARRREIDTFINGLIDARADRYTNLKQDFTNYTKPLRLSQVNEMFEPNDLEQLRKNYSGIRLNLWQPEEVKIEMNALDKIRQARELQRVQSGRQNRTYPR